MEAGESGGIAAFDGEERNYAAILDFGSSAIGEECFGSGFDLLFAFALIVVNRQVRDFKEATGLHVPPIFSKCIRKGIGAAEGGVAPDVLLVDEVGGEFLEAGDVGGLRLRSV